jgi:ABC-type Fe3+-hydroxamate transport system substrate-binding protein
MSRRRHAERRPSGGGDGRHRCAARNVSLFRRGASSPLHVCVVLLLLSFAGIAQAPAAEPPQRIISAAPSITEMLYALDLGGRVVGVTTFCHYPPEVRDKPKIGSYMQPNIETMLAMRPDLVVILKEHAGLGERLRQVGLTVLELDNSGLEGVYASLHNLGERCGVAETAERRIAGIQSDLAKIEARAAGLPRRSVMFIVGRTPGVVRDLVVVGRGSFLNELIEIAGGHNLFSDSAAAYPRIGLEELYAGRPEVIIDMGDMADTDRVTEEHRRSVASLWQQYPLLPAVAAGRVYPVAKDIFVVPGPRVVEAAAELLRMIHPEAVP